MSHSFKKDLRGYDSVQNEMGGIIVDDIDHAMQVATLSAQLFQVTWPLHGFDAAKAMLLRRAALLHDAGIVESYTAHHKLSQRIIAAATLPGVSHEEQLQIACIARYHRKALPNKNHHIYRHFSAEVQQSIQELGGLLRLADAFDFDHNGSVVQLTGYVLSRPEKVTTVLIQVNHTMQQRDDLTRIIDRAYTKCNLFERAFHCRVRLMPQQYDDTNNHHSLALTNQLVPSYAK